MTHPAPSSLPSEIVTPITVAIANDYELVVQGVETMLSAYPDRVRVTELSLRSAPVDDVDVILVDTFMGHASTIGKVDGMVRSGQTKAVVVYTWDVASDRISAARLLTPASVVSKAVSAEELVDAIERAAAGQTVMVGIDADTEVASTRVSTFEPLSDREAEVVALMAEGQTNKEIAKVLFVSTDTVKTYAARAYAKLGVRNRAQASAWATEHSLGRQGQAS